MLLPSTAVAVAELLRWKLRSRSDQLPLVPLDLLTPNPAAAQALLTDAVDTGVFPELVRTDACLLELPPAVLLLLRSQC